MTNGRPTMQQVAHLAGVSLKTVSRVVNDEAGVSPEMAERVREAVRALGYRHNLAASNLRRGRSTASIGMLVQDLSNDYCAELLRAVEARARARRVVVISASLDEEPQREQALVEQLVERRIDGLVLMPATQDQSYLQPELEAGLPVVIVDRLPQGVPVDSVTTDNRDGTRRAVHHLASFGHRRIGFLGDDPMIATAAERASGHRDALAELDLRPDPALERVGVRSEREAQDIVRRMLALPDPPTAFFTARNVLTVGAVRALKELDLRQRVAVVGFDDFPTADLMEPGITCVQQAVVTEGELAIDLLLRRMDGDDAAPRTEVVATTLIPRGSGEIPPR